MNCGIGAPGAVFAGVDWNTTCVIAPAVIVKADAEDVALDTPKTVTTTKPVGAPAGTIIWMLVLLQVSMSNAGTPTPFRLTLLKVPVTSCWDAPKFVPLMISVDPTGPEFVLRLVTVGGGILITVTVPAVLEPVPPSREVTLLAELLITPGVVVVTTMLKVHCPCVLNPPFPGNVTPDRPTEVEPAVTPVGVPPHVFDPADTT